MANYVQRSLPVLGGLGFVTPGLERLLSQNNDVEDWYFPLGSLDLEITNAQSTYRSGKQIVVV